MLNSGKRQDFLEHQWRPYPSVPQELRARGRIIEINEVASDVFVVLYSIGLDVESGKRGPESVNLSNCTMLEGPEFLARDLLVCGDVVGVLPHNRIILFAPNLYAQNQNFGRYLKAYQQQSVLRAWSEFYTELRDFFLAQSFFEMRTSHLVTCPGTEPSLDVFSTVLKLGSKEQKVFLPTSPELQLKKILALGYENIFEMTPVFRNGEMTERHRPEFTMLEWYRSFQDLNCIKQDVLNLVSILCTKLNCLPPESVLSFSVAELFQIHTGFLLQNHTELKELKVLAESLGVDVRSAESIDDFFFLIFTEVIEAKLPHNSLVFVEKYPPYQAALARLTSDGWGDRFEFYWKGLELGNAFHELNDPKIQRLRFSEDLEKKRMLKKDPVPLDEEFMQALEFGVPPSAGIAVGVDRLFMALFDIKDIQGINHGGV